MKQVVFGFIEPYCWASGIEDIAQESGFALFGFGDFVRDFIKNEGFGDVELFREVKNYLDNGVAFPKDPLVKICMMGIQPHLQKKYNGVGFF